MEFEPIAESASKITRNSSGEEIAKRDLIRLFGILWPPLGTLLGQSR